jgi:N-acyl-D-aspartate/D-glutamate deacylase
VSDSTADGGLLLAGGLLVDGTGAPPRVADVLIRHGRVVAVDAGLTARAEGAVVRDVTGRLVCPGFVDIHTHSDLTLLSDPRALSKVHQGVTTEVVGNCGLGTAPLASDGAAELRAAVSYLDLDPAVRFGWRDVGGYLETLAAARPGVNVAALAAHLPLRATVCGLADRPATATEVSRMTALLRAALDAGAVGLSTGLVYSPLPAAKETELLALGHTVAAAGRLFAWHLRNYDDHLLASAEQAVRVARRTGCRTQISHLAAVGRRNRGAVTRVLDLVDTARADGFDVGVDTYPYLHGNAPLAQLLPAWAQDGGPAAWMPRLRDPHVRDQVRAAWTDRPTTWDEITVSWTARPGPDPAVGHTVRELAEEAGASGDDLVLDLLAELGTGVMMTAGGRDAGDLATVLAHPATIVASDGLALDPAGVTGAGLPHPRSYGCFPRYLRGFVGAGPAALAGAVRRCTSAAAARVGLAGRGVVRPGAAADVVVVDPGRLRDTATYTDPHRLAEGIDLVLVNGVAAVDGGRHTGGRAGTVLRAPGREH